MNKVPASTFLGGAFLLLAALMTRLPGLAAPDRVVWDEESFSRFAACYLRGEFFFDIHPPLGKLLIAGAMALDGGGAGYEVLRREEPYPAGFPYLAARCVPAIAGSLLPLVVYALAIALRTPRRAAFLAGALVLFDTMLTVESRFVLIDILVPLFSCLAALTFVLHARAEGGGVRWVWLLLSALFAGMAVCTKWTGGGVLLAIALATVLRVFPARGVLELLARVAAYTLIPAALYVGLFWAHFALLPHSGRDAEMFSPEFRATLAGGGASMGLVDKIAEYHRVIWSEHQHYPPGHPQSCAWYTWPILGKWIVLRGPQRDPDRVVVLWGNPAVWLFGALGLLSGLGRLLLRGWLGVDPGRKAAGVFLLLLYASNWFPFALIARGMFSYHYLTALIASLIFAVQFLRPSRFWPVLLAAGVAFAVAAPFVYGFPAWGYWTVALPMLPLLALLPLLDRRRATA